MRIFVLVREGKIMKLFNVLKVLGSVLFLLFFVFSQFFAHEMVVEISLKIMGAFAFGYFFVSSAVVIFTFVKDLVERARNKKNKENTQYDKAEGFSFWLPKPDQVKYQSQSLLKSITYSNPPPNTPRPVPYMNPQNGISPLQDNKQKIPPSGGSALLPPLSEKSKSERLPPPPESLVGAIDGPPHKSVGKGRSVKVKKIKAPARKK